MPLSRARIEIGKVESPDGKKTRVLVGRIRGESTVTEITMYQRGKTIRAVQNVVNGSQEIKTYGYPDEPFHQPDRQTLLKRLRETVSVSEGVIKPSRTGIDGLNRRNKSDRKMLSLLQQADQREIRLKHADEIITKLPPLDLHLTGPGNKYETEAYAKVVGISLVDARRALVLTPNSDRTVGSR